MTTSDPNQPPQPYQAPGVPGPAPADYQAATPPYGAPPPPAGSGYPTPGADGSGQPPFPAQTPSPLASEAKKGSLLPWILVIILLVTTIAGLAWGLSAQSSDSKKQQQLTTTQARVNDLTNEVSTLQSQLDKTKGVSTEQAATLKNAKSIAAQMNDQAIKAAKEMNGVIIEFNNVVARFNSRDIDGANAAIDVANQHISQMKVELQKYDELAAQFDKAVQNV